MSQLNIRINEDVKQKAYKVCEKEGISISSVINMLLKKIGDENAIPYSLLCHDTKTFISQEKIKDVLLVYPLVENGTLSHGKAASILGMSKWEYIELLANIGIPYFTQDIEEVNKDVGTLKEILNIK